MIKNSLHIVLLSIILIACTPEAPTNVPETSPPIPTPLPPINTLSESELITEWIRLAREPEKLPSIQRPIAICDRLDRMHATALNPIVNLLGKPDSSGVTKVLVLQCINNYMDIDYVPTLLPLLDSNDPTTRSCATTLLGGIHHESVIELLLRMKQDPDPRVSFAAWSGLAQRDQEPHRSEFLQQYRSPDTTPNQRAEILRIFIKKVKAEDEAIALEIIAASDTDPIVRKFLVMGLAEVGSVTAIEVLQNSTTLDSTEQYSLLIKSTIAMIEQRTQATQ